MLKDAGILFLITLVSGLLLGLVYQVTKEPIAVQEEKARMEARQEVFQDADHFEDGEGFSEEAAQAVLNEAASPRRASTNTALPMTRTAAF